MPTTESIYERIHIARLRAEFEAGHGKLIEGARQFIKAVAAEMAAATKAQRLDAWSVVLEAEKLLLAHPGFTDRDRGLLYQELRFENQIAITSHPVLERTRIEKRSVDPRIVEQLKKRPEKPADLAAMLGDTDLKTLKKVLDGGEVTIRKANQIESKFCTLPTTPQKSFSGAKIKRAPATIK